MNRINCKSVLRRERVRQNETLSGLDYLEVGPIDQLHTDLAGQCLLRVYFLGKAPDKLDTTNILIEGGRRIRDIKAIAVTIHQSELIEFDDSMEIFVDKAGDFSDYTLRVVEKDERGNWRAHSRFDPRYDRLTLNFKVDCPNDFDCKAQPVCPVEPVAEPDINYLAKDYASFRQLILDRWSLLMPDWRERHVPDIGIALAEVLAYTGDHLSYYQDAVATEAYLNTARQRLSVRRHARLVDYRMHEGCNARTWLCVEVEQEKTTITPGDIYFITRIDETSLAQNVVISEQDLQKIPAGRYEVFEAVGSKDIALYQDHNRITFYTWGDRQCCIPKSATDATLTGLWIPPDESDQDDNCPQGKKGEPTELQSTARQTSDETQIPKLHLKPGDILIFEEVVGPETGNQADANPKHRHAVRLTAIVGDIDPLTNQPITHISWNDEDALPFPLCLSIIAPPPGCERVENVSIACANVVLVDHGQSKTEDLGEVPSGEVSECCRGVGLLSDAIVGAGRYNPVLSYLPLTFAEPVNNETPAFNSLYQDVHNAIPNIKLYSSDENNIEQLWQPQFDLLSSESNDLHFVAEIDDEGRAHLRFGNGELGKKPQAGMRFSAHYRIRNGVAGNVGAESISHLVFKQNPLDGVICVRNPIPAQGGTEKEPVSEVKLFAPYVFRKELQRAVIADDYAKIVLREFKLNVQNAAARLRWNGSWYEVWVAVDPWGREEADQDLLDQITARLYRYRRMGHDLVVQPAKRVPLDIELAICVRPNYLRGHVKAELLTVFSHKTRQDGKLGFFHPDNLSFGDDIYLSKIVAVAQAVQGVESVQVTRMQRFAETENGEIEKGVLSLGPFEIARLDNDPSFPENGKLTLAMRGGR